MLDLDIPLDEIIAAGQAANDRHEKEFTALVAQLRAEPEFRDGLEKWIGAPVDPVTPEGVAALARLVNDLGSRDVASYAAAVREEVQRLRVREEARAQFDADRAEAREPLPLTGLGDLLAADMPEEQFAVEGLLHIGGNVLFTAARKSGKSTVIGNLIRSLVDGDDFLGAFRAPVRRKVALVDLELSPATLQRWLREQEIVNTADVTVVPLRGRARAFDILNDATRAELADQLRGHDTIILDPLRPLADALDLNEHTEMGRLLEAFDALKAEAGISEGIVVHHHGHGSDRARGDSRLEDWPDALWRLHRDDLDDPNAIRTFSAFGRDVAVEAGALRYEGRRLTFVGDMGEVKAANLHDQVVAFLRHNGESKTKEIENAVAGLHKNNSASVLQAAVTSGAITHRKDGVSNLYSAPDRPF